MVSGRFNGSVDVLSGSLPRRGDDMRSDVSCSTRDGDPARLRAVVADDAVVAGELFWVLQAAAEDGVSVSAWMTTAARRTLLVRDGLHAVAEWEQEHGRLTEAEHMTDLRGVAIYDDLAAFAAALIAAQQALPQIPA